MEMSIDEAIRYYEDKNVVLTEEEALANTIAISTMRKYQKIEEIIADWKNDGGAFEMSESYWLKLIREVVEDGKID